MIRTESLTRRYGAFTAVDRLSLEIPPGEVFGFLGPNGAGKTTTIKMLTGLLRPTSGRIFIDGLDFSRHPVEVKRILGYIPERPFLYGKLTPLEYLRFVARLWRVPPEVAEERIAHYLELFVLQDRRDELIESLSHGMRQKLVIAAAFVHAPRLIVVDEPMVGLDPLGMRRVKELFRAQARSGGAVFLSTHDLVVAEEICDRVGIINGGRLIAVGSMAELRAMADAGRAGLEEIFLRLTVETSAGAEALPSPGEGARRS
jgi:ABC-2 type transport system ATP-binding protein